MKFDLHTHFYTQSFFDQIRDHGEEFDFTKDPTGRTIIRFRGSRFFGITAPMTDPQARLDAMDEVGIDVEVLSLSTPNVFFTGAARQPEVARAINDDYASLIAEHPKRFKGFASIPMDDPDAALAELHRALKDLKLNGVILTSNIRGRYFDHPDYRPFFEEANRMQVCIFIHPMLPANAEPYSDFVLGPIIAFPCDTTLSVARLCYSGMLRDLPDIRWLVGHAGGTIPWLMERMDNGYRDFAECQQNIDELPSHYLKRLYYDTVTFSPHTLRFLRDAMGADHMVMGSDFPHLLGSIERAVTSIENMQVPQAEKDRIFSGTALSILNNV